MSDLCNQIAQVSTLSLPSAAKHVLIILLARQQAGEEDWPGQEALTIDTSIPSILVEKSIANLRMKGILKLGKKNGKYCFRVLTKTLAKVAGC